MRLTKNLISTRYANYDARVIDFLNNIYEDISKEYSNLSNYFLVSFDLLAEQLKIYYMASDALEAERQVSSEDSWKRLSKHPAIGVQTVAHKQIMKILEDFSLSPFANAKLKRAQKPEDDGSAEQLVAHLIA